MTNSSDDSPQPFNGPYEDWNFGLGSKYSAPSIQDTVEDFYSAIAEFVKINGILNVENFYPIRPPIWKPLELDEGVENITNENLRFVPFLFQMQKITKEDFEDSTFSLRDSLTSTLNSFTEIEMQFNTLPQNMTNLDGISSLPGDRGNVESNVVIQGIEGDPNESISLSKPRYRVNLPLSKNIVHKNYLKDGPPQSLVTPDWTPSETYSGKKLSIIGVIEDTIPFAHETYLDSSRETRVEFCWIQSATADNSIGKPTVPFGRELTREKITSRLEKYDGDENLFYRKEKAIDTDQVELGTALNSLASHGSIVMDVAAGNVGRSGGGDIVDEVRVIAVQLPKTVALETSGFGKDMFMLAAFHYIFERAQLIAKEMSKPSEIAVEVPLTVNFSYGFAGGSQDGQAPLEQAIDEMVAMRRKYAPTAVVMPSGNLFQDRLQGVIDSEKMQDGTYSFYWNLPPNDRTSSYLEIWFPDHNMHPDFKIELYRPDQNGSEATKFIEVGGESNFSFFETKTDFFEPFIFKNGRGEDIGQISRDRQSGRKRWRVLIAIAPTEPEDYRLARAEIGAWKIVLTKNSSAENDQQEESRGPIFVRVQRDNDPELLGTGSRQSFLSGVEGKVSDDPLMLQKPEPRKNFVQSFGAMNGISTGKKTISVGGYYKDSGHPSVYSSAGLTQWVETNNVRQLQKTQDSQVNCSAPSDRSKMLTGLVGAGNYSGSFSSLSGTSVAAPLIARKLAAAFLEHTPQEIKASVGGNYLPLIFDIPRFKKSSSLETDGDFLEFLKDIRLGYTKFKSNSKAS